MFYYIYQITNIINRKIYIGVHKTKNLDDGYMGSGKIIRRAIEFYGIKNFKKDILEFFNTYYDALLKEKEIVNEEFLSREDTYNLRRGGLGGWDYINKNEEILKNKSIKYMGIGNPFYGKTHSDEIKLYLSKLAKDQFLGVPKSESHKKKISEALSGVKHSEERRKNISNSMKGKSPPNKGKPAERWICHICGFEGGGIGNKNKHIKKCENIK